MAAVVVSLVIVGLFIGLPYVAKNLVEDMAYEACIEVISGSTSGKCRCLARDLAQRMVTYDYFYRRLIQDQDFPEEEMNQIRRGCGLVPSS